MTTLQKKRRCAIYTRKSTEEGLDQAFNSLDAQREACESYIKSQQHEGWTALKTHYDDGGFSGGNTERPALTSLLDDIKAHNIDVIVVYKVDRLSRSLVDFVRLVELFDEYEVSFVSVTQQFNTSSSMGRLTLNVLLSFAQFEREVTSERIRDKIAASKQKGLWMGGRVPIGYDVIDKTLAVNETEATIVRHIYQRYLKLGCVRKLKEELDAEGYVSKAREENGEPSGGTPFGRGALYALLKNPLYIGMVAHQGKLYEGQHAAILDIALWEQVQTRLADNKNHHTARKSVKDPSLLAGLLFDDNGNPMSPTHTKKGNKRYRYYINQTVLQYREKDAGSVLRLPAKTIEGLVNKRLAELWTSPDELLTLLKSQDLSASQQASLGKRAKQLGMAWTQLTPHQQMEHLKTLLQKVCISQEGVSLHVSLGGLLEILELPHDKMAKADKDACPVLTIPVQLKRCGIETKLIRNNFESDNSNAVSQDAIRDALCNALEWHNLLSTGNCSSTTILAANEGVTQRYIAHLIELAYLSPDLIKDLLMAGTVSNITLTELKKYFPLSWKNQHAFLKCNYNEINS